MDQVATREEEVRCVLLCVQDFVRSPHFTQRNFFYEPGVTILSKAAAIFDSITSSCVCVPYGLRFRISHQVSLLQIWRSALRRHLIGVVLWRIRASSDMLGCCEAVIHWNHVTIPRWHLSKWRGGANRLHSR